MEWLDIIAIALYFYVAGVHGEYNHNHTCKMAYSVIASLFWPLFMFVKPKPRGVVPKFYRKD